MLKILSASILLPYITMLQLAAQTGTYTVQGSLTLTSASSTEVQLSSVTDFDKIAVTGIGSTLTLGGPLTIVPDGYTPNNTDKFEIASFPGTTPTGTFSSVSYPSGMSTWMIDYGVLFPGKVTIYGPQALPVSLVSFDGQATERGNELTWQTATEINSDYFGIEYSKDGKTYVELDRVRATGQISGIMTYHYLHSHKNGVISYYRLRQVDFDESIDYSKTICIQATETNRIGEIAIYPNPTEGILHFSSDLTDVTVYNASGRMIKSIYQAMKSIDLTDLPCGTYRIIINNGAQTQTIIIK